MKFSQKYILPIFHYLLFILVGFAAMTVVEYLVVEIYDFLAYILPDIFKTYSQIKEPELYRELMKWLTVISVGISLLLVNYIAMRQDNKRFEYVITLTDGLYTMREGLLLYIKNFLLSDIVVALVIPSIVMIPFYFVPEPFFERWLSLPFWCYDKLTEYMGIIPAVLTLTVLSLISRLAVIYPTVKVWRAMWLTSSVE